MDAPRPSWRFVLEHNAPLLLPAAHDALTARLIERAGFPAYQIGGFAVAGTLHALPDLDLEHFGEKHAAASRIIAASRLPVLVDSDDGYGDVKNVTRAVRGYESIGASALFIEDQKPPKRCGHMAGKEVIPPAEMEQKLRAAAAARNRPDFFILARTDAREPEWLASAFKRGERYLAAGADGIYVEGLKSREELAETGRAFKQVPLATSILERGGETPWVAPEELKEMGFDMLLYPTTLLFRLVRSLQRGLAELRRGAALGPEDSIDLEAFEDIVGLREWAEIENRFMGAAQPQGVRGWIKQAVSGS